MTHNSKQSVNNKVGLVLVVAYLIALVVFLYLGLDTWYLGVITAMVTSLVSVVIALSSKFKVNITRRTE